MTRPTVSLAEAWRPDALRRLADGWEEAARRLKAHVDTVTVDTGAIWKGAAAEAARDRADEVAACGDAAARALVTASVAARDGADQITTACADVLSRVDDARADGFAVNDDGTVSVRAGPPPLLVALSGGDPAAATDMLRVRAAELSRQINDGLDRLGDADADAANDIAEAFSLSPSAELSRQVGNSDGVPWDRRVAANRINIAQALIETEDPERTAFYRSLLGEVDDPAGSGQRVDRQILAFDPDRAVLVELNGNLSTASSVAVLIPGLNTTIMGSAATTEMAKRFVSATHGDVAAITYLGGAFPQGSNLASALAAAADPRYALDIAPRLVAFSEDVDQTVDGTGRSIPVTYIGHSYGGSILGTAEALGMTADRTLYVAAAGAGVGVDDPGDWHNRNPDLLRFSMTAPGDFIEAVQGFPGGPHGADPDEMPGIIRLATGDYDDGWPVMGPRAHSDVLNRPSDAWRHILAVITGDSQTLHQAG